MRMNIVCMQIESPGTGAPGWVHENWVPVLCKSALNYWAQAHIPSAGSPLTSKLNVYSFESGCIRGSLISKAGRFLCHGWVWSIPNPSKPYLWSSRTMEGVILAECREHNVYSLFPSGHWLLSRWGTQGDTWAPWSRENSCPPVPTLQSTKVTLWVAVKAPWLSGVF